MVKENTWFDLYWWHIIFNCKSICEQPEELTFTGNLNSSNLRPSSIFTKQILMYLTLSLFPMECLKLLLGMRKNPAMKEFPFQVENIPMRIMSALGGKVLVFLGTFWRTWSRTEIFIEWHLLKSPQRDPINFTIRNLIKNNNP